MFVLLTCQSSTFVAVSGINMLFHIQTLEGVYHTGGKCVKQKNNSLYCEANTAQCVCAVSVLYHGLVNMH